jgi:hypothetical protein
MQRLAALYFWWPHGRLVSIQESGEPVGLALAFDDVGSPVRQSMILAGKDHELSCPGPVSWTLDRRHWGAAHLSNGRYASSGLFPD